MDELFVSEHKTAAASKALDLKVDPIDFGVPYFNEIVREHLTTDHLCVLAKGLGLHRVAASLLFCIDAAGTQRHGTTHAPYDSESLVLLLNVGSEGLRQITENLASFDQRVVRRGIQEINSTTPMQKRAAMYAAGGVYSVTSRILTVDMITSTVDVQRITGLIIFNAHWVGDNSKEAFIVKLLRDKNEAAFIKALSDEPHVVSRGLNGLQHRLRSLGVTQVSLWPRFRMEVKESLGKSRLEEVIVEMDQRTLEIQHFLHDIIQKCISQIKYNVRQLETESWTVDLAYSGTLHRSIRSSVDPVYHKLNFEAKQAIHDLHNLQHLLSSLCNSHPSDWYYDAQAILLAGTQEKRPPLWLELPSADAMYSVAKQRLADTPGKWNILVELLAENAGKRILVMCSDNRTVHRLKQLLIFRDGLGVQLQARLNSQISHLKHVVQGFQEDGNAPEQQKPSDQQQEKPRAPPSKRRRVRGGASAAPASRDEPLPVQFGMVGGLDTSELQYFDEMAINDVRFVDGVPDFSGVTDRGINEIFLCSYDAPEALKKLNPDVVIMYEPDVQFTRELEVYQAVHGVMDKVYFMYYQRSVEELAYLTRLRREKDTFSSLIKEKAAMPMVINDDFHRRDPHELRVVNTRIAGGNQTRIDVYNEPEKVIVDAREFMSDLPFLIWRQGIEIIPMQLEVGDYILTPEYVIERKSIPDLMSSFNDGRLFDQCTKMFRHYAKPVLLIEFNDEKAFSFDQFRDVQKKDNILYERLSIVMLLFPKLKIIWSSSQQNTAEIFEDLKRDQKQPDPKKCAEVGRKLIINTVALDMLRAIPGVDFGSATLIAEKLDSLADLAEMPFEQLMSIVGRQNATAITNFLDKKL